jgi:hypothetical protein
MKTNIREYLEEMDVEVVQEGGRWVIVAFNECGYNSVYVDLLDVLQFVRDNMPDLLEMVAE